MNEDKDLKAFCSIRLEEFNSLWEKYMVSIIETLSSNRPMSYEERQVIMGLPIEHLNDWFRNESKS